MIWDWWLGCTKWTTLILFSSSFTGFPPILKIQSTEWNSTSISQWSGSKIQASGLFWSEFGCTLCTPKMLAAIFGNKSFHESALSYLNWTNLPQARNYFVTFLKSTYLVSLTRYKATFCFFLIKLMLWVVIITCLVAFSL